MSTSASPTTLTAASTTPKTRPKRSFLALITPYLLIAPTMLFVFLFTIWPSVQTVAESAYEPGRRRTDPSEFVGLQNYADLLDDSHYLGSRFTRILTNTLVFTVGTAVFSVPLALGMALLLNRRIFGRGLWRFSIFYPSLLPLIGAASFWAFLYADSVGLINTVLRSFGFEGVNWLGDPDQVMNSIILVNVWKQSGYYMIFYLAGLQSIPKDIYEAAELAGANYWQQLWYLTLPMLQRTTLFILIIAFTFGFQTVEQLQVLNQGNPADRGNLLLYFIFQNIGERRNLGYINAMTVILVFILLVFTISNFLFFERRETND